MAGIARAAAETYARFDIPSIPLGRNKKPSIGDFKVAELSVQQSMAWFRQRPNADALGVPDGRLSGIVRLDIDEHANTLSAPLSIAPVTPRSRPARHLTSFTCSTATTANAVSRQARHGQREAVARHQGRSLRRWRLQHFAAQPVCPRRVQVPRRRQPRAATGKPQAVADHTGATGTRLPN
jgi:hypothetical protein